MCCISAVVLVLLVVFSVQSHSMKQKNASYQEEIAQLEKQMEAEEARSEEIEELKEYVQSDEYAEQVAKDKLGLVYEDEIIFKPEED
ncbi:MAG: septum formation initiator family protein [Hominisplanchenecus sp.]